MVRRRCTSSTSAPVSTSTTSRSSACTPSWIADCCRRSATRSVRWLTSEHANVDAELGRHGAPLLACTVQHCDRREHGRRRGQQRVRRFRAVRGRSREGPTSCCPRSLAVAVQAQFPRCRRNDAPAWAVTHEISAHASSVSPHRLVGSERTGFAYSTRQIPSGCLHLAAVGSTSSVRALRGRTSVL